MRWPRRLAIATGAVFACVLGIAWVLPPLWDWNGQRPTIEALAEAALGRVVRIEGKIDLTLLPEPILTARQVRVGGAAEGGALRIGALRLGVALAPLLRGRVIPRQLVLRGLELDLPWPPTGTAIHLPAWYAGVAARIEDGQINIGAMRLRGITATLETDDDGTLKIAGNVPIAGQRWQAAARISHPGPDGTAHATLTLAGPSAGLAFTGTLDHAGHPHGRLAAHGPDFSLWAPAPARPFRAEGELVGDTDGWAWRGIGLDMDGMPAHAALALVLAPTPQLRGSLAATRINLDGWAPTFGAGLSMTWDVDIEAASLGGAILRQLRGRVAFADGVLHLSDGQAMLPGAAMLRIAGQMRAGRAGSVFEGAARLETADPRPVLQFLATMLGLPAPNPPAEILRAASLAANVTMGAGQLALHDLEARIDQSTWRGAVTLRPGQTPAIQAQLMADQLSLDPFLPDDPASWYTAAPGLIGAAADIQLRINAAGLAGRVIDGLALDAVAGPDRQQLRRLEGVVDGAHFAASGTFGPGGRFAEGKLEISAETAAPIALWFPQAWRGEPALWDGRLALRAEAAGTADALAVQLGLDLGDARLDVQPVLDLTQQRINGRMSLRHPNAARLLAGLGLAPAHVPPNTPVWPGEGSLALQAQFHLRGDQIAVEDFDLTAGALRATGRLGITHQMEQLRLDGRMVAETLPLPFARAAADAPLPFHALRGWLGNISIQAGQVLLDDATVLERLQCPLMLDGGVLHLTGCTGTVPGLGGEARIDASIDGAASPPVLQAEITAKNARIHDFPVVATPDDIPALRLRADQADIDFSARAAGHSVAALRGGLLGMVRIVARDGAWRGFDLPAASAALARRPAPDALPPPAAETAAALGAALEDGETPFQHLEITGAWHDDRLEISNARSTGPAGDVRLSGYIGPPGRAPDLRLTMQLPPGPSGTAPPPWAMAISGSVAVPRRMLDIAGVLRWLAAP